MRVCFKCRLALDRPSRTVVAHGNEWHRGCWKKHLHEVEVLFEAESAETWARRVRKGGAL